LWPRPIGSRQHPEEALADEASDEHEPATVVEPPGQVSPSDGGSSVEEAFHLLLGHGRKPNLLSVKGEHDLLLFDRQPSERRRAALHERVKVE
jgi:hypothetical protein